MWLHEAVGPVNVGISVNRVCYYQGNYYQDKGMSDSGQTVS